MRAGMQRSRVLGLAVALVLFLTLVFWEGIWGFIIGHLYPELTTVVYPRATLWQLVKEHCVLVGLSSGLSVVIGVSLGAFVTRRSGRDFLPTVNSLVAVGQTFPPVAVLALAVPAVGFGAKPTIIALFLYGLLPIVRNTIVGIESVPREAAEAATGMGMTGMQSLLKVELPLSFRVIMAGIKTSVIINIGTATIGATIGAGGLGAPIITGLASDNPAFILKGSVVAALLAIVVDGMLDLVEQAAAA